LDEEGVKEQIDNVILKLQRLGVSSLNDLEIFVDNAIHRLSFASQELKKSILDRSVIEYFQNSNNLFIGMRLEQKIKLLEKYMYGLFKFFNNASQVVDLDSILKGKDTLIPIATFVFETLESSLLLIKSEVTELEVCSVNIKKKL